MVIRAYNLID